MIISRKQSPSNPLKLFGSQMQRVDCCKYLGLLFTTNLTWSAAHISSICSNAKKILSLIYMYLQTMLLSNSCTYRGNISSIPATHLIIDKKMLENVQKFGCRVAAHQWDTSYQELLKLFELQPLKQCRLHVKLGLIFKIIHKLCYFPSVLSIRDNIPYLRAPHSLPFNPPLARTKVMRTSILFPTYYAGMEHLE